MSKKGKKPIQATKPPEAAESKPVVKSSVKKTDKNAAFKSAAAKARGVKEEAAKTVQAPPPPPPRPVMPTFNFPVIDDQLWFRCAAVIVGIAAFLRLIVPELRPVHHDEGVNGFFLTNLIRDGIYKYDPANYHGPSIYFITLPLLEVFGYQTWAIRLVPAVFGTLVVVMALFLRRYIGNLGSLVAAFFLAISAGMLFISRYFIHEMLFVFFTIAAVVAVLLYLERRSAGPFAIVWMVLILLTSLIQPALMVSKTVGGESASLVWLLSIVLFGIECVIVYYITRWLLAWDEGRPIYLMLASASVSMLFATKETAFISIGTMAIACVCVFIWKKIKPAKELNQDWFRIVIGAHLALAAVAIYFRTALSDAWEWTYEWYLSGRFYPPHYVMFTLIVFVVAASLAAWVLFLLDLRKSNETEVEDPPILSLKHFMSVLGDQRNQIMTIAAVVTVFVYLFVLFFTSFFTYKEGVGKAFEAYNIWSGTGTKEHAQNGYFAYLKWNGKVESPLLFLSLLGSMIAMLKTKHRFAMFTALWAIGVFAAYTIIPYKTPWLALSYLLPMCLIAGYGLNELYSSRDQRLKLLSVGLIAASTVVLGYQSYFHNFVAHDDDKMPYVYAHTRRGFLGLMEKIDYYAQKTGKGPEAVVDIVSPDYWPMCWYTLKYNHANYYGHIVDINSSEFIVVKKKDQDTEAIQKYSQNYKFVGMYPLRPGVDLNLLVRRDIADPDTQELSVMPNVPPTP